MQDSVPPSAPNKLISSVLGQANRIRFAWSILTITVNDIFAVFGVYGGFGEGPGASLPHLLWWTLLI